MSVIQDQLSKSLKIVKSQAQVSTAQVNMREVLEESLMSLGVQGG